MRCGLGLPARRAQQGISCRRRVNRLVSSACCLSGRLSGRLMRIGMTSSPSAWRAASTCRRKQPSSWHPAPGCVGGFDGRLSASELRWLCCIGHTPGNEAGFGRRRWPMYGQYKAPALGRQGGRSGIPMPTRTAVGTAPGRSQTDATCPTFGRGWRTSRRSRLGAGTRRRVGGRRAGRRRR